MGCSAASKANSAAQAAAGLHDSGVRARRASPVNIIPSPGFK
jgi:hypothetical protein